MQGDFFYLKTPEEMAEAYRDIPEALENTHKIAEMCDLKLDFERLHLPEITLPPEKTRTNILRTSATRPSRAFTQCHRRNQRTAGL